MIQETFRPLRYEMDNLLHTYIRIILQEISNLIYVII